MAKERRRLLAASAMVRARRDRASGAPSPLATRCRACSTSMSLHSTLRNDATNVAAVSPPTFLTSAAGQAQHWSFVRSIQQGTKQCKDLHKVIKQTYRQINIGALSELPTATEFVPAATDETVVNHFICDGMPSFRLGGTIIMEKGSIQCKVLR